jgi:hypothetical protein
VVNRAYYDWPALAVLLVVLWWVAYQFTRRTYRFTVGVLAAVGVLAVTGYGLRLPGKHPTFESGLLAGGNAVSRDMLGGLIPADLQHVLLPGPVGWLLLLVLIGGVLLAFDAVSVRRQQPTVNVGSVPPSGGGSDAGAGSVSGGDSQAVQSRQVITEELKFRLPAVAVRSPSSMPGGSTLASLATVVSDSEVQGSKLTAALMQAVHALEARPRIYEVQIFVDHCEDDGTVNPQGEKVLVTVDLRDARSGQTLATRILRPCRVDVAAEKIAGFTARWVFRADPSTPAWATGSYDGEDLSAYLLAQEIRSANRTYQAFADCRKRQREILADAVRRSTNAGLVQYDLAALDDLDGRTIDSLRLHLDNRVHNPRFLPARYRLAVSLAGLGGAVREKWPADPPPVSGPAVPLDQAEPPFLIRGEIADKLAWSGLLRTIRGQQFRDLDLSSDGASGAEARQKAIKDLLRKAHPDHDELRKISQVLLMVAYQELRAYRRRMRASWLLLGALIQRQERAAYLDLLRTGPSWRRHPRLRMATPQVALTAFKLSLRIAAGDPGAAQAVDDAQAQTLHQLGLDRVLDGGGMWIYGRLPWQGVYNAACLCAMSADGVTPRGLDAARKAVKLLRLAITDPACELDRPSEWIGVDPSLVSLRGIPEFDALVRQQAHQDFDRAKESSPPRPSWFQQMLPYSPPPPPNPPRQRPRPGLQRKWIAIRADTRRLTRRSGPSNGS